MKILPRDCPSCGHALAVKRLTCEQCGTEVEGLYELPVLSQISSADHDFIVQFVKASGSLKEMAALMKVSYPTVRNRLDEVIATLRRIETIQEQQNG